MISLPVCITLLLLPLEILAAPVHKQQQVHAHGRNRFVQAAVNDGWVIQDQSDRYHPGVQVVMSGEERAGAVFTKTKQQWDIQAKETTAKTKPPKIVFKKIKKENADKGAGTKPATKPKEMDNEWIQKHKHAESFGYIAMNGKGKAGETSEMGKGGNNNNKADIESGEVKKTSKNGKERAKQRKESMMKEWYENAKQLVKQNVPNGQMGERPQL